MEIRPMQREEIPDIGALLATAFQDDPLYSFYLRGLDHGDAMMRAFMTPLVGHYHEHGEVWIADDGSAMLSGHFRHQESIRAFLRLGRRTLHALRQIGGKEELSRFEVNAKAAGNMNHNRWKKRVCHGEYYFIDFIAIDKAQRGTGIFRQLVDPILHRADASSMPVLLDTHNPDNLSLYRHFGFELVREYGDNAEGIKQYCMMREPHSAGGADKVIK